MISQLLLLRQQTETKSAAVLRAAREEVTYYEEEFLHAQEQVELLRKQLEEPIPTLVRVEMLVHKERLAQWLQEAQQKQQQAEQRLARAEQSHLQANRAYSAACVARKLTEEELSRQKKREAMRIEQQQDTEALEQRGRR